MISYDICCPVSGLLHLVWSPLSPSMSGQMALFHFLYGWVFYCRYIYIYIYIYTTSSVFIHPLMDILKSCQLIWVNLFMEPLFYPLVYMSITNIVQLCVFIERLSILLSASIFGRVRCLAFNLRIGRDILGSL